MKTISAERFEAWCLKIIDEVKLRREPLVITKKEKPVARLLPVETEGMRSLAASQEKSKSWETSTAPWSYPPRGRAPALEAKRRLRSPRKCRVLCHSRRADPFEPARPDRLVNRR